MTQKRVPLGNYVTEYSVRNKDNEDIPVYSVTNSQGFCREYFGKEVASKDKTTYKIVPYGYFAYNPSRINVGSVDWQRCEAQVIVSPLYNVFSVSDELDRQFLYYFLKSNIGRQMIRAKAAGSVRDNLKLDMLKEMTIPDSSLDDQRHCVATLDNLQYLIELRKKQLNELDDLVKARFVEVFGDPVRNPMQWDTYPLEECLERIDNGKSFICSDKPRTDNNPAILKLSAATYGDYRPLENKALLDESLFVESAEVHAGDLLFTRKNTPELVGMAAYVQNTPSKLMMPDLIFRLVPNEKVNAVFLWQLINCKEFRPVIQAISGGSAKSMSNISKERLGKIKVICPPRELQDSLIPFVKQLDKSKVVESIHRMNVLFNITLNGGNRYDIRANEF